MVGRVLRCLSLLQVLHLEKDCVFSLTRQCLAQLGDTALKVCVALSAHATAAVQMSLDYFCFTGIILAFYILILYSATEQGGVHSKHCS